MKHMFGCGIIKSKYTKKGDWLLLGSIILIAAVLFLFLRLASYKAGYVHISYDGADIAVLSLTEDTVYEVESAGSNTVVISAGKVFVESADCPDQICVKHIPVSMSGETIICLPHKLAITISSKDTGQ